MSRYSAIRRIRHHRLLVAGALLIALMFQAMIPTGFMPATDGSFALKICPHDSNHQSGGHSHVEFCSYGALPGAAPLPHLAVDLPSTAIAQQPAPEPVASAAKVRFERAHSPRAPPSPALG
jgi:hypothetical protein